MRRRDFLLFDDFVRIAEWKTRRQKGRYPLNRNYVEDVTGLAFRQYNERRKIALLCTMDGVDVPVASAILHFGYDATYPIMDVRAVWTLWNVKGAHHCQDRNWVRYLDDCRNTADYYDVTVRELDKALWQYSFEHNRNLNRSG
ncbi:hypothetical protein [Methylorubrum sp. POS3]|uniref:hypothetical protein n=1 Tax=Methylorubrum sp. POS3 TaxID=2998492 RepID=UPI00372B6DBE